MGRSSYVDTRAIEKMTDGTTMTLDPGRCSPTPHKMP
jgi:hypothetical protein